MQLGSSPFQALQPLRFELHAERGSFRVFGTDPQEELLKTGVLAQDNKAHQQQAARHGELADGNGSQNYALPAGDYAEFYRTLARRLSQGDLTPPVPLEDALLGLQLLELAEQSSRQGRTLYLA